MNATITRFIELVLAPRDKGGTDSTALQRQALERMREQRPGMLIDQIEEPAGSDANPARARALLTRLRSHAEARTFDELRVFEIGRLFRAEDPSWHEGVLSLVQQSRAVLVDTAGLTSDPAQPVVSRAPSAPRPGGAAAPAEARRTANPPPAGSTRPAAASSVEAPAEREPEPTRAEVTPSVFDRRSFQARRPTVGPTAGFTALCEGRVYCETCGQPLSVQSLGHERKRFYACASPHLHPATDCQPLVSFPVEAVDQFVWAHLAASLEQPAHVIGALREALNKGLATGADRRVQHQVRLERLERDELEVLALRSEDRISESAARKRLDDLARERRNLEDALRDGPGTHQPLRALIQVIEEVTGAGSGAPRSPQAAQPAERRRLVLAALPDSAEHGVHPQVGGSITVHSILDDHDLTLGLRDRARALGSAVQSLTGRVAEFRAPSPMPAVQRIKAALRERLRPPASPSPRAAFSGAEPGALQMPLQPPRQTGRIVAWGVALTAALLIAIALQPPSVAEGEPENLAGEYGFGDQLAGLHRVPGGWVGQTNPAWAGATDAVAALAVCRVLSAQLSPGPRDTITLLRPEGVPLTECGPPLDALEDPP